MGRVYTVNFDRTESSAVQLIAQADLFEFRAAGEKPVALCSISISCLEGTVEDSGSTNRDWGSVGAEMSTIRLVRYTLGVSGVGGITATVSPLDTNDAATGLTVEAVNDSTLASTSAGNETFIHSSVFNVRTGWKYTPAPELRPILRFDGASSDIIAVRISATVWTVWYHGNAILEEL